MYLIDLYLNLAARLRLWLIIKYSIFSENYYHGTVSPEASNHFNDIFMNERNYNLIEDPQSDYEAIDTSLFGWWKAKLRKSQIRKVPDSVFIFLDFIFPLIIIRRSTKYCIISLNEWNFSVIEINSIVSSCSCKRKSEMASIGSN